MAVFFTFPIVLVCTTSILVSALFIPRQDDVPVGIETAYLDNEGCSVAQVKDIHRASYGATQLAAAALDGGRELVNGLPDGKYVNFHTTAAMDYFGPPDKNTAWRTRIKQAFYGAVNTVLKRDDIQQRRYPRTSASHRSPHHEIYSY